jgi:hypothetical protein
MAANDVNTLAPASLAQAEQLEFGCPHWTAVHSIDGAADAVVAGVAGVQHFVTGLTLSFDVAPAAGTLTIEDGSSVIWQAAIPAAAAVYDFDFSGRPLPCAIGAAAHGKVSDPGGSVVACITLIGFSSRQLTTFT